MWVVKAGCRRGARLERRRVDNATISANLDAAVAALGLRLKRRRCEHEAALERVGLAGRTGETIYEW